MSANFSWSDTLHIAVSSCLPCFGSSSSGGPDSDSPHSEAHNPTAHRIPRARPDELQGLLVDPDTDTDAERLSLHSNPGLRRSRKKKQKSRKRITFFGYDLFGRPVPGPIHLPDSDDDEPARAPRLASRTSSSMTFDSDAAPLDSSVIETFSEANAAAAIIAREEELRQKAERRANRRERREQKRMARLLEESFTADGEDFEGFQGSGDGFVHIGSPRMDVPRVYGGGAARNDGADLGDDVDGDADLDGGVYARVRREPYGTSAGSRSDSRSRTSASRSDVSPRYPVEAAATPRPPARNHTSKSSHSSSTASTTLAPHPASPAPPKKTKPKSKSKSSSQARSVASRSTTSATTSQSASLASPTSTSFQFAPFPRPPTTKLLDLARAEAQADDFDGSQGLTIDDLPSAFVLPRGGEEDHDGGFSVPRRPAARFPSTGFGRRPGGKESILAQGAAFLATRGDGDD